MRFGMSPARAAALADRHPGIGCDQLIVIEAAETASAFMRIYNPDGSEAGACGNATRCVADILMRESGRADVIIRTDLGGSAGHTPLRWPDRGRYGSGTSWTGPTIPLARPMDTLRLDVAGRACRRQHGQSACDVLCR